MFASCHKRRNVRKTFSRLSVKQQQKRLKKMENVNGRMSADDSEWYTKWILENSQATHCLITCFSSRITCLTSNEPIIKFPKHARVIFRIVLVELIVQLLRTLAWKFTLNSWHLANDFNTQPQEELSASLFVSFLTFFFCWKACKSQKSSFFFMHHSKQQQQRQ